MYPGARSSLQRRPESRMVYQVPTAPGWGIEIDEAVIAAHPEDPDAKLNMFARDWEQHMCK